MLHVAADLVELASLAGVFSRRLADVVFVEVLESPEPARRYVNGLFLVASEAPDAMSIAEAHASFERRYRGEFELHGQTLRFPLGHRDDDWTYRPPHTPHHHEPPAYPPAYAAELKEGGDAAWRGALRSENPYRRGTGEHATWDRGWDDEGDDD